MRANRPRAEVAALHAALRSFRRRVAAHPAVGKEVERHGTVSWRVFPLSTRLPYLVWYFYDETDVRAPVSLVLLVHEAQDRATFDPP